MDYHFIGWCREGASDKVWVVVQLSGDPWLGSFATIWGRRGKKLQYKVIRDSNTYDMERLEDAKVKRGYKSIEKTELDKVYPEFEQDLEMIGVWATLSV